MANSILDSIYWVEVDKIEPNPFQPRKSFDEAALASLAESIRQYGILQPLTVTRKEIVRPGEGIFVKYELIAGERRLRASKIAGLTTVPVVIRSGEDTNRMKLELAIIENLQREDLNPLDRAKAFRQLADEFGLQHKEIGQRVGKSREYVSNTLRILLLPIDIQEALQRGEISEGHTRPLLMLADRPAEQHTLFLEIMQRRLTVRDTEALARRVAVERVRHKALVSPDLMNLEKQLSERLGTRVRIEKKDTGGKLMIDFFSPEDLTQLCLTLTAANATPEMPVIPEAPVQPSPEETPAQPMPKPPADPTIASAADSQPLQQQTEQPNSVQDDLYSIKNFSV